MVVWKAGKSVSLSLDVLDAAGCERPTAIGHPRIGEFGFAVPDEHQFEHFNFKLSAKKFRDEIEFNFSHD